MSVEKGLLSELVEDKVSRQLDDLYKGSGIIEMLDGKIFKMAISLIDNKFGEKVKDPLKTEIREVINQVYLEEDPESALTVAFEFIDSHVDIPFLDDAMEDLLFKGLLQIVVALLAKVKPSA